MEHLFRVDAEPHLQNQVDKLKNKLKQIEIKETQGVKIRAKITWEHEGEKFIKHFFKKLGKRKNAG